MQKHFFKSALVFACLTALVACSSEERQEAPAPDAGQSQKATDQVAPATAADQAVAEAKKAGEHIGAAAEKSVEAAEEAAATAGQQVKETAEQVKESTSAMVDQAQQKTAEVVDEGRAALGSAVQEGKQLASESKEATEETLTEAKQAAEEAVQEGAKTTGAIATQVAAPEVLTYEAMNGNVTFDHSMHSKALSCAKCHEVMPPQKIAIDKTIAHQLCTGCHREMGAGPTACNECHIK
jgi:hypothetical protein